MYFLSTATNLQSIFQYAARNCPYNIMSVGFDGSDVAFSKSYSATGGMINITLSLPPMKHFNVSIVAYNAYGNTSFDASISE